jgi:CMP/dCMP kinase
MSDKHPMIITISGKAGSGKSTVAKLIAKKLGLKHYSVGDVMREMASDKGMTLLELNKKAETDKSIDFELDDRLKRMGKEKDNFVVDGRLTAFFIPHAAARIFLDAQDNVRAKRILGDVREEEINDNLKSTLDNIEKREASEKKRYRKYYNVDYMDHSLYNLLIDTSDMVPEQVADTIVKFVKTNG